MKHAARGWMVCALTTAFGTAFCSAGLAQNRETPATGSAEKVPAAERASGVIVKVETIIRGNTSLSTLEKQQKQRVKEPPRAVKLTINTAAVWRDWARDQATAGGAEESPRKAAERGEKSVGTGGEPVSTETTVLIHLDPQSRVETRFRAIDDASSKGKTTAAEVRREEPATAPIGETRTFAAKPVQFSAADLRPGLFVEVDYHHLRQGNKASTVAVIRPVGEPRPPASAKRK